MMFVEVDSLEFHAVIRNIGWLKLTVEGDVTDYYDGASGVKIGYVEEMGSTGMFYYFLNDAYCSPATTEEDSPKSIGIEPFNPEW